jgi:hypothetical protein
MLKRRGRGRETALALVRYWHIEYRLIHVDLSSGTAIFHVRDLEVIRMVSIGVRVARLVCSAGAKKACEARRDEEKRRWATPPGERLYHRISTSPRLARALIQLKQPAINNYD